ncbi:MAG TPA: hypothetical protein VFR55_05975 [Dehalococcoidia bacterium]|nr:hypothetical protein [Dehalococcoidia bacterium]
MARLAEQRLLWEGIPSVVRSLGVGPGLWGTAGNLPQALEVLQSDAVRAAEVLELPAAQLTEGAGGRAGSGPRRQANLGLIMIVIVIAGVLIVTAPAFVRLFR